MMCEVSNTCYPLEKNSPSFLRDSPAVGCTLDTAEALYPSLVCVMIVFSTRNLLNHERVL